MIIHTHIYISLKWCVVLSIPYVKSLADSLVTTLNELYRDSYGIHSIVYLCRSDNIANYTWRDNPGFTWWRFTSRRRYCTRWGILISFNWSKVCGSSFSLAVSNRPIICECNVTLIIHNKDTFLCIYSITEVHTAHTNWKLSSQ